MSKKNLSGGHFRPLLDLVNIFIFGIFFTIFSDQSCMSFEGAQFQGKAAIMGKFLIIFMVFISGFRKIKILAVQKSGTPSDHDGCSANHWR